MQASAMSPAKPRTPPPSAKMFRLKHVRNQRECEQVAAVCYRARTGAIEFLLVRTGSGHWTFPKGGVEPGLSHAQAAALEAFEEAGVHGRMEEASFARYVRRRSSKSPSKSRSKSPGKSPRSGREVPSTEVATSAHLCEVVRLVTPQEADRNPTWFSADKARKKLAEGRDADFAAELVRVVDRAVARIERLTNSPIQPADALQRVQFEVLGSAFRSMEVDSPPHTIDSDGTVGSRTAIADTKTRQHFRLGPMLVADGVTRRRKRLTGGTLPGLRN